MYEMTVGRDSKRIRAEYEEQVVVDVREILGQNMHSELAAILAAELDRELGSD